MRAVVIDAFGAPPEVRDVPDPQCPPDGVVVRVSATGLCRSDWHGWMGHDADIRLPHVPGHEFAGEIVAAGADVRTRRVGERVTAPFVCACGRCATCRRGDGQVCERQQQPGFTHWGSFAQYVVVDVADVNAVPLPDTVDATAAASLGCRFATAYRAVLSQGRLRAGDTIVVVGCGGVGLAAVQIAVAQGARVIAVDPAAAGRRRALDLGADAAVHTGDEVRELTGGGADLTLDAVGGVDTLALAVACLRPRGRHVQVGLLGAATTVPASIVARAIACELELVGSHGMAARDYPEMLRRVERGELDIARLVGRTIPLTEAPAALAALATAEVDGVTLIVP